MGFETLIRLRVYLNGSRYHDSFPMGYETTVKHDEKADKHYHDSFPMGFET